LTINRERKIGFKRKGRKEKVGKIVWEGKERKKNSKN